MFCVVCGFRLNDEDFFSVCLACSLDSSLSNKQLGSYVPSVCGDVDCYLNDEGMPNFDGECGHEAEFVKLFSL